MTGGSPAPARGSPAPCRQYLLRTPGETGDLARSVAGRVRRGDTIALSGPPGAGKTVFAGALIRELHPGPVTVASPTFPLVQVYDCILADGKPAEIRHVDLYRLDGGGLRELGLEEDSERVVTLIEWPERLGESLSGDWLLLRLCITGAAGDGDSGTRQAGAWCGGDWRARLERPLPLDSRGVMAEAFCRRNGLAGRAWESLAGDASMRRYYRSRGEPDLVLMDAPGGETLPWAALSGFLRGAGYSAPEVLYSDTGRGFLVTEDLGDDLFPRALAGGAAPGLLYGAAMELLLSLWRVVPPAMLVPWEGERLLDSLAPCFDWYFPLVAGRPAARSVREDCRACLAGILPLAEALPPVLCLRDFHAGNLVWLPGRKGHARIGLLDFQDACLCGPAYDAVSLLCDPRRPAAGQPDETFLRHCLEGRGVDADVFLTSFHVYGALRQTRILGIWARLAQRDGKPGYLCHMDRSLGILDRHLAHPALAGMQDWRRRCLPVAHGRYGPADSPGQENF